MKKHLLFLLAVTAMCTACDNKARLEKEAQEQYEKEARKRADAAIEECLAMEKLVHKATGATSKIREERMSALFKLKRDYPEIKVWEELYYNIADGKTYDDYDQIIYDIKKMKGWTDIDY